jgi:hypothetical protein
MKFYLVDIKSISSDLPRSQFNSADIDDLAEAILTSDGLIRPLVLKQQGIDKYTVVEGHLEYYAAVRAKEKNARQAEMVNAFVIPDKIEDAVKKQAQLFNHSSDGRDSATQTLDDRGKSTPSTVIAGANISSSNDTRMTNLELRLEQRFNEIQSSLTEQIRQLNDRVKELEAKSSKPENPLQLINTLTEADLVRRLKSSRISKAEQIAKAIVTARNKQTQKQFVHYRSIVDALKGKKLLSDTTLINIIDVWSKG